jgi:adenine/guanine phosphoribosyltransferase-like PRPP-binding protein
MSGSRASGSPAAALVTFDATVQILEEIVAAHSCCIVDDVSWDAGASRFRGSFLWHGIPTSARVLHAFADFAVSVAQGARPPAVVAGVSTSGIAWATAVALRIGRPLAVLRLQPHRYGVQNQDLTRHRGVTAWLVDNFVGSGDTIRDAQRTLEAADIEATYVLAVESLRANPVVAALTTETKLQELLQRDYFGPLDRQIVERYLNDARGWLDDAEWVLSVKKALSMRAADFDGRF